MLTTRRNSDDDVPNFEAMINAVVANALPNLTAALRTQITNDIRNGAGASGGGCWVVITIPPGIHFGSKETNIFPTPLIERVIISTPMKNHMLIDHEYVNCPLRFDDRIPSLRILLPIHMGFGLDVILGMEVLASHRATMTAMQGRDLCSNLEFLMGPRFFQLLLMDTSWRVLYVNLSCSGFADVFPDELPGLPPARWC
ncbi:hypothetical protein Tco_0653497 [Tanacetum coccineum]|uniref:Uncharacterized protein n=1 Tax=Tanacetum coccineum TaxID=301880 RepID=A0ABQ4X0W1_9ASTR